ncbi:MAG: hypothetical protein ACYSU4_03715, partial [Planctomycetota bacterium]
GGVKTNQCSLDSIIEEIDVHNKAYVLYGIIILKGGSRRSPYFQMINEDCRAALAMTFFLKE